MRRNAMARRSKVDSRAPMMSETSRKSTAHNNGDASTEALMQRVNASGHSFVSHCRFEGADHDKFVLRVSIGSLATRREHLDLLWRELA